jgi:protein-export membrane protein SecD
MKFFFQHVAILILGSALFAGCSRSPVLAKAPDHGVSLIVQYDAPSAETNAPARLQEALAKRLDQFGTKGHFEPLATNRLRLSIPITEPKHITALTNLLAVHGQIEFRVVHPQSADLVSKGQSAVGYEKLVEAPREKGFTISYLVKKEPDMTGEHIKRAFVSRDPLSNKPTIMIDFDETGKSTFADVTVRNIGYQLAIVLDGKLISAPRILQEISGGSAVISGSFTAAEAKDLANALQTPLPFAVKVQVEKTF